MINPEDIAGIMENPESLLEGIEMPEESDARARSTRPRVSYWPFSIQPPTRSLRRYSDRAPRSSRLPTTPSQRRARRGRRRGTLWNLDAG